MCYLEWKNEWMFMYSSKIGIKDVIHKLRSLDETKIAAKKLRKLLLPLDFKINVKWVFFAALFNIEKCLIRDTKRNLGFSNGSNEKDDNNINQLKSE